MEKADKQLVVLIPAYNESSSIQAVISQIPRQIKGIANVHVLVMDDGSSDDTANKALAAGADTIVSNARNLGLGRNFKLGLEKALSLEADIIVNLDADGQFNCQDIPKLIQPIVEEKAGMVTGSRFLQKETTFNIPWLKKIGNWGFTKLICAITNQKFTDTQCGFRAYSREAALKLNLFGKFTYTQEAFIELAEKDVVIVEVPVEVKYFNNKRKSKISSNLIFYGFRSLGIIANATRDTQPLSFFGLPGFILFALGFIGGVYSFVYWITHFLTSPIKTIFTVSIFFMTFGLLLIIFGLLADMLKRIKKTQEEILFKLKKKEYKKE